jgi:hypothetical protein
MTTIETPIEITYLPSRLRADFTGKLAEATADTIEQNEQNFLSRSLAAFAIHKLAGCSLNDAADSVVDGCGDGGIDALYHSPSTHYLWVVQSKFIANGRGEPSLGDVTKFKAGLENLLQGNFTAFSMNEAWRRIIPRLQQIFRDGALQVRAILVYSGIHLVSEDRKWLFEDLTRRFSPDSDYLQVQHCNLTTIHDWMTGADEGPGVPKVEITLQKPGWVKDPYETIYGLLPIHNLAQLYNNFGKRLIVANIRAYKGATEVNQQIATTIRDEPEHFFYLNNGLTAYCERLDVHNLDRANAESKRITAYGFSIINGAQTLGAIAKCVTVPPATASVGYVFMKIISLERCSEEQEFAERITYSSNFQNQIGSRDFAAMDEAQERIANQLMLSGINYHFKDDAEAPKPDESNFTLDEATTALACLIQLPDCDFVARTLANRRSLWSFEEIYLPDQINRSRYSHIFRQDRSARTVWRAVQTQRAVIQTMQASARPSNGARKAFYENARWLVLNIIFLKLRSEHGDALALTPQELTDISAKTQDVAEILWDVCEAKGYVSRRVEAGGGEIYETTRHFRSVFSMASDCQLLRAGTLASINAPAAVHNQSGTGENTLSPPQGSIL